MDDRRSLAAHRPAQLCQPALQGTLPFMPVDIIFYFFTNILILPFHLSQSIVDDIQANEAAFVPWYNNNEPEKFPIPILEPKIADLEEVCMYVYMCVCMYMNTAYRKLNQISFRIGNL